MGEQFSLTAEQREKIRQARLGRKASLETRLKMSLAHKANIRHPRGWHLSEETRSKLSLARMGNTNNCGKRASLETRAKMSIAHSGSSNAFYGKTHTPETCEAIRLSRLGKPTTAGRKASAETRLLISQNCKGIPRKSATRSSTYKQMWANSNWAAARVTRIRSGATRSPNNAELCLLAMLEKHCPNEWKFVGDGSFVIDRMNPDFININGKKQIIELFGEYWHEKHEEQERIAKFASYGFATLVIWESELSQLEIVLAKLENFNSSVRQANPVLSGDEQSPKCVEAIHGESSVIEDCEMVQS
jgi:hypothetical protein